MAISIEFPHNNVVSCSMNIPVYGRLSELIGSNTIYTDKINADISANTVQYCILNTETTRYGIALYLKNLNGDIRSMAILISDMYTDVSHYAHSQVFDS